MTHHRTSFLRRQLYWEIVDKGALYAFSDAFLDRLRDLAAADDRIVVEAFDAPVAVDGMFAPAIGVARLREASAR